MRLALLAAATLSVIDGDTLRLGDERIRLLGVDAPEIFSPGCPAERMQGDAARLRVETILAGAAKIEIERAGKDRYRRTLARVRVDGEDLGRALLAAGYAKPWPPKSSWCG